MTFARLRIIEEIANLEVEGGEIKEKLSWFECRQEYFTEYKLNEDYLLENSVPRKTGFIRLTKKSPCTRTPVQQRSQRTLIKKGQMDIKYFQQVQEELMSTKKSHGMTSFGTHELNVMIKSMVQMVQHGNKKRADEMKIYQEIRNVKATRKMYIEPSTEPKPRHYWHYRTSLHGTNRDTEWKRSIRHITNVRLDEKLKIRKDQMGRTVRVSRLKDDPGLVRSKISRLQKELKDVNIKRVEACNRAYKLGEQLKELMDG